VTPPKKPRAELQRLRDQGLSFKSAWPIAMSSALRDEPLSAAIWWRTTFSEQRTVWAVSYSRAPWPAKQRPTLFASDDDQSLPSARVGPSVAV
jgi:hypothetical protein